MPWARGRRLIRRWCGAVGTSRAHPLYSGWNVMAVPTVVSGARRVVYVPIGPPQETPRVSYQFPARTPSCHTHFRTSGKLGFHRLNDLMGCSINYLPGPSRRAVFCWPLRAPIGLLSHGTLEARISCALVLSSSGNSQKSHPTKANLRASTTPTANKKRCRLAQ